MPDGPSASLRRETRAWAELSPVEFAMERPSTSVERAGAHVSRESPLRGSGRLFRSAGGGRRGFYVKIQRLTRHLGVELALDLELLRGRLGCGGGPRALRGHERVVLERFRHV